MHAMRVLVGLVAVATVGAQTTFTWQGPESFFGNPVNWNGASPVGGSGAAAVNLGSASSSTASAIGGIGSTSYTVGRGLNFGGNVLLDFDMSGGEVTLNFNGNAAGSASTFLPGSSNPGRAYDFSCDANWQANGPSTTGVPCASDIINFPAASRFWLFSPGTTVTTGGIIGQTAQPNCSNNVVQGSNFMLQLTQGCSTFNPSGATCSYTSCSTTTTTTTTTTTVVTTTSAAPTVPGGTSSPTASRPPTFAPTTTPPSSHAPSTLAPITFQPTSRAPTGSGPPVVATHQPTTLAPVTLAPTSHAPTTHAPTTASPTTASPTLPVAASTGGGGGGSNGMLIIVIIILIIVIVAVGAVIYLRKDSSAPAGAGRGHEASFSNPLYDGAAPGGGPMGDAKPYAGLYADTEENSAGGYMDIPADGENSDGYMDLPVALEGADGMYDDTGYEEAPGGGNAESGYMDTSPMDDGEEDV